VPISIPAPGAAGSAGFLIPSGASEFAQLTHVDQAELTEWVRYDQIIGNDLVRSEATALNALYVTLTHGIGGTFNGAGGPAARADPGTRRTGRSGGGRTGWPGGTGQLGPPDRRARSPPRASRRRLRRRATAAARGCLTWASARTISSP
jgi:hypothetical protein